MAARDWKIVNESIPTPGSTVDGLTKKKTRKKVNIIIKESNNLSIYQHQQVSNKPTTRINTATVSLSVLPTVTVTVDWTDAASDSPVDFFNSKQHLPLVTFSFSFLRSSCWKLFTLFFFFGIPIARRRDDDRPTDRPTTGVFYFHGSIPFQFLVIMVRMWQGNNPYWILCLVYCERYTFVG